MSDTIRRNGHSDAGIPTRTGQKRKSPTLLRERGIDRAMRAAGNHAGQRGEAMRDGMPPYMVDRGLFYIHDKADGAAVICVKVGHSGTICVEYEEHTRFFGVIWDLGCKFIARPIISVFALLKYLILI